LALNAPAATAPANLEIGFTNVVHPFVDTYCVSCHSGEKAKAQLDLTVYPAVGAVVRDHKRWDQVLERLQAGEMPPEKAKKQPDAEARKAVIDWIQVMRRQEAEKHAGD